LQVGNTHATGRVVLFKNLNYILREIYDILSEDAVNYPVLPADSRQSLALDAFLQSINNLGLKQHLLVAEVETMERALRLGNAYFQADSKCWPGTPAKTAVHVTTAAAEEPVNLTTSLVRELLAKFRQLRQQSTVERPRGSRMDVDDRRRHVCWGCGSGGHFIRRCPHGRGRQLNGNGRR